MQACELIEKIGPCEASTLTAKLKPSTNTSLALSKPVRIGLIKLDKSQSPFVYSIHPDWRRLAEQYLSVKRVDKPRASKMDSASLRGAWW